MDCHDNTMARQTNDSFTEMFDKQEAIKRIHQTVNRNSCAVYSCSINVMTECDICGRRYCYEHLELDLHNLHNMGFINKLKETLPRISSTTNDYLQT